MHRINSKCKTLYETNSVTPPLSLETSLSKSRNKNSFFETSKRSPQMVVKNRKFGHRQINNTLGNVNNSNNRRIKFRVRRSHQQQSHSSGYMVSRRKTSPHKFFRNGGSFSNCKTFSPKIDKQKCSYSVRQFNRCSLHKQTRRHSFSPAMYENLETLAISARKSNFSESCTHCREKEHSSRPFKQGKNSTNGMVIKQRDNSCNVSDLGDTSHRSFRLCEKSTNTDLLLLEPRPSGLCNRCSNNSLEQHVCICLPSNLSNTKNTTTHDKVQLSVNSNSPTLAAQTLVHKSSEVHNRLSKEPASQGGSITPAKNKHISSKSSSIQSDCMVFIDKQFKEKGFSKETRKLLRASWRSGTQKDYSVKFRKFNSWCSRREIDPYSASLTEAAEFLTFLFSEGLQYRTIAGYRSMLSSFLAPIGKIPVGQHPYITRLIKGVFNSRPPKVVLLPEWDLPLVLKKLKQAPFEPMKHAHLKFISWKTAFLIAITSFRRCSDLQSLCIGEESIVVQKKGVTFVRHGLSKQDRPKHFGSKIFIPSYQSDKLLDPKRSIYYYLKKTAPFRNSDSEFEIKLFLSFIEPHKPVTSQTISSWIVNAIKCAYNEKDKKFRAHSTRALGPSWALFNGASVKSIMDTADWTKESTFTRFYLRHIDVEVLNSV
ncbi:uncharacterized protein LOC134689987 [Mytilus trossulus]|uniref:uncharacterized protein LOC134689987 n=1 Tax=Mytilus trossulus TaxID=6551 RepID=UPI003005B87A